jgi:cytochrome c553
MLSVPGAAVYTAAVAALIRICRRTWGTISMIRLHTLGLAAAAALLATASAHAEGDKAAGRTLVYTCAGCHGVPGYSNAYPDYPVPKIAGQNEQYIVNALNEYKSGDRTYPTMMAQAQSLSEQNIQDIAAYLSSLTPIK